jgi:hypothetical protein
VNLEYPFVPIEQYNKVEVDHQMLMVVEQLVQLNMLLGLLQLCEPVVEFQHVGELSNVFQYENCWLHIQIYN